MESYEPPPVRPARIGQVFLPLFLLLIGIPAAANLYIEMRWFDALGHGEIFSTILSTKLVVGTLIGLVVGLVLAVNLRLAHVFSRGLAPLFLHDPDGVPRVNLSEVTARLVWPASIMIGLLTGLFNYRHWATWLLHRGGVDFGVQDPIFGRDVGFYMFDLPLLSTASSITMWAVGVSAAGAAAVYIAGGALTISETSSRLHPAARAHLSVLAAIVLAILAFNAYLDMFQILYSTTSERMDGASYADVNAKLPALRLKIALAAVGAVLILASITREGMGLAILAVVLYVAAQFAVQLYPSMVHKFSVLPNELERETPYIKNNIEATRAAYGLDDVTERELSAQDALTAQDIANNAATVENIRLWDHRPLLDTFAQIQEIRTYYDFKSVDNDRYIIDGRLRQTMLSPRELPMESVPAKTWINERFFYTHGYGLTLGPVNETTPQGLPVLFVKDIPPVSDTPSIKVTNPSIYFGELSNDHVFVRTAHRAFHRPSGEGNVETDYDGDGGIRFDSTLLKLALATKLGELKLLLTDDIDSDSRVLLHRNIRDRVSRVAPFLELDPDPYMVVRDDGTLVWIFDAYTASAAYPYAQSSPERINYIRNSVKAVVDAYHGTVDLYIADAEDPIIQTWQRIFPDSFKPMSEMPDDVRFHLRYPELIFQIQTQMFTIYHMAEAQLVYNREDEWQVPDISSGEAKAAMEPYYTVMKLPGEKEAEFIQMLPFTPKRKDNLAAWMVARSDADKLGELVVYTFPKDRLIFGPQQVVNRINQDAEISRQISLWDQRGSQAVFGTLLVIPIEESLIYVRPLYLRSQGGKIPELKRVIVAYENEIAMEPSLAGAMDAIFGKPGAPRQVGTAETAAQVTPEAAAQGDTRPPPLKLPAAATRADGPPGPDAVEALRHFEAAVAAQRAGDWAAYGAELEQVEKLLRKLQPEPSAPAPQPAAPPPTPEPATPEAPKEDAPAPN